MKNITKYYDLWAATFLNVIEQVGIENVIDKSFIDKTNEIMKQAVRNKKDLQYYHKKLVESRA